MMAILNKRCINSILQYECGKIVPTTLVLYDILATSVFYSANIKNLKNTALICLYDVCLLYLSL